MKVLIVNKFLYPNGGSETYIFKLGETLEKKGHEVQYFGMEHEGRIVGNEAESYTSDMDFHTGRIKKLLYPFQIIYSVEARKKIRNVLNRFTPDVVHLNNFNFQLTPSIIYEIRAFEKKTARKIKIIYTAHDSQFVCPNHLMRNPLTGDICTKCIDNGVSNCIKNRCLHGSRAKSLLAAFEHALYHILNTYEEIDCVICPSEFLKNKLETYKAIRNKLIVMHNFVDRPSIKTEAVIKKDYVVYFGRYSEEKGIQTLLKVCRRMPEIPFVFVGSGPMEEEINKVENITNKGFLSGEKLQQIIGEARFSVIPSECYENCPFSVMESQIYGTPVLGANLGGIPELISDGETGELFTSKNEQELYAKIYELWHNKEKTDRYIENCRNVTFDTAEKYCEKILKIYGDK